MNEIISGIERQKNLLSLHWRGGGTKNNSFHKSTLGQKLKHKEESIEQKERITEEEGIKNDMKDIREKKRGYERKMKDEKSRE